MNIVGFSTNGLSFALEDDDDDDDDTMPQPMLRYNKGYRLENVSRHLALPRLELDVKNQRRAMSHPSLVVVQEHY